MEILMYLLWVIRECLKLKIISENTKVANIYIVPKKNCVSRNISDKMTKNG